MKLRIYKVEVS